MQEKTVLLFSNSKSVTHKENSLSHFSGEIPANFLERHKEWKVSLQSCGLHLNLKQKICSKNEAMPALICISFKDFKIAAAKFPNVSKDNCPLDFFQDHHKVYINGERSYTARTLATHIRSQFLKHRSKSHWYGYPVEYDRRSRRLQFGQFEFDGNDEESGTFVFINKYFCKHLNLAVEKFLKTTLIGGELYYLFFNSDNLKSKSFYPFKAGVKKFPLETPKIINVVSSNIVSSIYNNDFQQCLKQFTVTESDVGRYVQYEFEDLEFSQTHHRLIDKFDVKFMDENFKKIRLRQGLPSYIKLIFSPIMNNEEHIRISSESNNLYTDNSLSNFSVELPKILDFSFKKNPKVALTRISLQNKWKLMSGLRLDFFLLDLDENETHFIKCDKNNGPRTCKDIRSWFEKEMNKNNNISLKKLNDGSYTIVFNKKAILIFGRDLSQLFGFGFVNKLAYNSCMKIDKDNSITTNFYNHNATESNDIALKKYIDKAIIEYEEKTNGKKLEVDVKTFLNSGDIVICGEKGSEFILPYLPRSIELFPNNLYVYSNIVAPSAVLGEYKRLLRIVPLPHNANEQSITIDFPRPDFHALSELKLRSLQFKIATIDGRNAEPYNNFENIYFNLLFVHDE